MPGLIWSPDYVKAKEAVCKTDPRADEVIDGIEWLLTECQSISAFPTVRPGSLVRSATSDAAAFAPPIIVTFGPEMQPNGEEKLLLLDVWVSEDEDDEDGPISERVM